MRESKLSEARRIALLWAAAHAQLGRFGTIITAQTVVQRDRIVQTACLNLAQRLEKVAIGMKQPARARPARL